MTATQGPPTVLVTHDERGYRAVISDTVDVLISITDGVPHVSICHPRGLDVYPLVVTIDGRTAARYESRS